MKAVLSALVLTLTAGFANASMTGLSLAESNAIKASLQQQAFVKAATPIARQYLNDKKATCSLGEVAGMTITKSENDYYVIKGTVVCSPSSEKSSAVAFMEFQVDGTMVNKSFVMNPSVQLSMSLDSAD